MPVGKNSIWDKIFEMLSFLGIVLKSENLCFRNVNWQNFPENDTDRYVLAIEHLENMRCDIREEMKQRMRQRDSYAIQMMIVLGGLVFTYFTIDQLYAIQLILIVLPPISIYFTILLLYSYRVTIAQSRFLKFIIEPKLSELLGVPIDAEWNIFRCKYYKELDSGVRQAFFLALMVVLSIFVPIYIWGTESDLLVTLDSFKVFILQGMGILYIIIAVLLSYKPLKEAWKILTKGNDCSDSTIKLLIPNTTDNKTEKNE